MRAEYVRGKTPEQLKDVFALPYIPTEIVNVEMPGPVDATHKSALWTGIAGPIAGWGNGGSVQVRIMSDPPVTPTYPVTTHYFQNPVTYVYPPGTSRQHRQPLANLALSFLPMTSDGNNRSIATYLDSIIPTAYSDLETIYNDLDYLNWNSPTYNPTQAAYTADFNQALQQVGSQPYEALSFLWHA